MTFPEFRDFYDETNTKVRTVRMTDVRVQPHLSRVALRRARTGEKEETMKFLVLGAGRMGRSIAYDLIRAEGTESVVLAERDAELLAGAMKTVDAEGVVARQLDLSDGESLQRWIDEADAVVSAVPYDPTPCSPSAASRGGATSAIWAATTTWCARELALDERAAAAGVSHHPRLRSRPRHGEPSRRGGMRGLRRGRLGAHARGRASRPSRPSAQLHGRLLSSRG